jgi:hypothetical protein
MALAPFYTQMAESTKESGEIIRWKAEAACITNRESWPTKDSGLVTSFQGQEPSTMRSLNCCSDLTTTEASMRSRTTG